MDKKEMMDQIMALDFTLVELNLYLDTHPYDSNAISYFNDYKRESMQLKEEYEKNFGPLTAGSTNPTYWEWLENPWPWEKMFV